MLCGLTTHSREVEESFSYSTATKSFSKYLSECIRPRALLPLSPVAMQLRTCILCDDKHQGDNDILVILYGHIRQRVVRMCSASVQKHLQKSNVVKINNHEATETDCDSFNLADSEGDNY